MSQPVFSSMLRDFRRQRFLNMSELARRAGIVKSHISMMESGTRRPGLRVLAKLSSALELNGEDMELFMKKGLECTVEEGAQPKPPPPPPANAEELMAALFNIPVSPEERAALSQIIHPHGPRNVHGGSQA